MRDILFKAKRIDNGEWVEGSFVKAECLNGIGFDYVIIEVEATGNGHIIDKSTLCQYTGLTDKNGNMIWENDVVKDNVIFGTVIWEEKNARFMINDVHDGLQEYSDWWHEVEVIGNIFDNPELLEGGTV